MEQNKYNIFVSYCRADIDVVTRMVGDIHEKTNARCWVDWRGIESGAQFEDVIVKAIDNVDVVLFVLSDSSMSSAYVKKEIAYARNTGKKVVPVVVDGGKLRGWFLFQFGQTDYIDMNSSLQYEKLIRNIGKWYGDKSTNDEALPTVEKGTKPNASTRLKEYKIGDYYNEGGKQGIVFDVTADGKHGKIVSLDEFPMRWANDDSSRKKIGAMSIYDGMSNLSQIKTKSNWVTCYPAFVLCVTKGNSWYLPAKEELLLIYQSKELINKSLRKKRFTKITGKAYWSSTEKDVFCACCVLMNVGYILDRSKREENLVRAVATF